MVPRSLSCLLGPDQTAGQHIVTGSRGLSRHVDCLICSSPCASVVSFVIHGNSSDALYNPIKPIVSSLWLARWRRGTKGGAMWLLERSAADVCGSGAFARASLKVITSPRATACRKHIHFACNLEL